jgi:hypothetical protein
MKCQYFFLVIILSSCISTKNILTIDKKLEIVKIDTAEHYFVFNTKNVTGSERIILAEKEKVKGCLPFKKYIIADSVYSVSILKLGSRNVYAGFYVSTISGVKIRNKGELIKVVNNCESFAH